MAVPIQGDWRMLLISEYGRVCFFRSLDILNYENQLGFTN